MKVEINDKVFYVRWQYNEVPLLKKGFFTTRTTCIIRDKNKEDIDSASIVRYFKDNHSKPEARERTFRLVMRTNKLTKEEKTAIWKEFRKRWKLIVKPERDLWVPYNSDEFWYRQGIVKG